MDGAQEHHRREINASLVDGGPVISVSSLIRQKWLSGSEVSVRSGELCRFLGS
jgi:hypothetical protein